MEKRCVVIKMFGNQDMAGAIAPALMSEEDRRKMEENKRLDEAFKRPSVNGYYDKEKLEEYYRMKLEDAEQNYRLKKEPFFKRWFDTGMAMLVIFLHACVREVEDEER